VHSGRISIKEACRVYKLSVDEFHGWERSLERYGIPGLCTTRYQIYRDSERRAERVFERLGNRPGLPRCRTTGLLESAMKPRREPFSDYIAKKP
jgi:hypothetical protein